MSGFGNIRRPDLPRRPGTRLKRHDADVEVSVTTKPPSVGSTPAMSTPPTTESARSFLTEERAPAEQRRTGRRLNPLLLGYLMGPAALVGRATGAADWHAGGTSGTAAGLAFGIGHWPLADRLARHGSTPNRDVTKPRSHRAAQLRFLNRQLVLPVSMMSQWWVRRSSIAVVILASPNTWGQSAKARLVVISREVFS